MIPGEINMTWYKGATHNITIDVDNAQGAPFELTGTNTLEIYRNYNQDPVLEVTLTWNGTALVGTVTAAESADLEATQYPYHLWNVDGATEQAVIRGVVAVSDVFTSNVVGGTESIVVDDVTYSVTVEGVGAALTYEVNVKDYGAKGDGVTDDTAAIQAAIDEGYGNIVRFPAGRYKVTSTLTATSDSVALVGDSKFSSEIYHVGNYGDTLFIAAPDPTTTRLSYVEIRNLTISTSSTPMLTGAHIHISDAIHIVIENVQLWNGFISMKFQGIQVAHINSTTIKTGSYFTTGILTGSRFVEILPAQNTANKVSEVFFTDFNWSRTGNDAIEYGLYVRQADGIWFSNGHIFGAETLCRIEPATTSTQLAGVMFDQVWFDDFTITKIGVHFTKTGCTNFQNIVFNNCRSNGCLENSFVIDTEDSRPLKVAVNGGIWGDNSKETFLINGGKDIVINPDYIMTGLVTSALSKGVSFTNKVASSFSVKTMFVGSATYPLPIGIDIQDVTKQFLINDCVYSSCTTHINMTDHARSGGRIGLGTNVDGVNYANVAAANDIVIPTTAEIITLTGGATTINTIGYGWEGRRITLRPVDATQTIANDVGSTAGKILTNTGANITLTQYRALTLTYSAKAGAWVHSI